MAVNGMTDDQRQFVVDWLRKHGGTGTGMGVKFRERFSKELPIWFVRHARRTLGIPDPMHLKRRKSNRRRGTSKAKGVTKEKIMKATLGDLKAIEAAAPLLKELGMEVPDKLRNGESKPSGRIVPEGQMALQCRCGNVFIYPKPGNSSDGECGGCGVTWIMEG